MTVATYQHRHNKALHPTAYSFAPSFVPHFVAALSAAGELGRCLAARGLVGCARIMDMKLTELRLGELSNLQYAFHSCPLPHQTYSEAIIVSFTGDYGIGSGGNGSAQFMTAIISAALAAWEPSALIIDLRELKYEWGDLIAKALCAGDFVYVNSPFPTAVVASDLNRAGLTSLLRDEMFQEPTQWLFDTIKDALASVEAQIEQPHKSTVD